MLVDGQGNFGSIDGDTSGGHALYRDSVDSSSAEEMLKEDIDKETVDWIPRTMTSSLQLEPTGACRLVIPNLLVNGSAGIAVGMATNIPPHNLDRESSNGRDFDDRGSRGRLSPDLVEVDARSRLPYRRLYSRYRAVSMHGLRLTVRGTIQVRAQGGRSRDMPKRSPVGFWCRRSPIQVNKAKLHRAHGRSRQATRRLEGISDIRDESDRDGIRIVIEHSNAARCAEVILNQPLQAHSACRPRSVSILLAIVDNQPQHAESQADPQALPGSP